MLTQTPMNALTWTDSVYTETARCTELFYFFLSCMIEILTIILTKARFVCNTCGGGGGGGLMFPSTSLVDYSAAAGGGGGGGGLIFPCMSTGYSRARLL
jgi:hypothetical protein